MERCLRQGTEYGWGKELNNVIRNGEVNEVWYFLPESELAMVGLLGNCSNNGEVFEVEY